MKVIILAGGRGSRIGQRTSTIPKPMLPIGNKPILWHIMNIYSSYGYNEFIICLGYLSHIIKNYFFNYNIINCDFTINLENQDIEFHNIDPELKWKVTLAETGVNTLKGGRIKRIQKYLNEDINMLTYGDGLADINISELIKFHKSSKKILTITAVYPPSRFGEIIEKEGKYLFSEKPQTSASLINGGFMVFSKEMLDYITEDEKCDFEHGPLDRIAEEGQLAVYKHLGSWDCVDTERDYQFLNKLWDENKAFWHV